MRDRHTPGFVREALAHLADGRLTVSRIVTHETALADLPGAFALVSAGTAIKAAIVA